MYSLIFNNNGYSFHGNNTKHVFAHMPHTPYVLYNEDNTRTVFLNDDGSPRIILNDDGTEKIFWDYKGLYILWDGNEPQKIYLNEDGTAKISVDDNNNCIIYLEGDDKPYILWSYANSLIFFSDDNNLPQIFYSSNGNYKITEDNKHQQWISFSDNDTPKRILRIHRTPNFFSNDDGFPKCFFNGSTNPIYFNDSIPKIFSDDKNCHLLLDYIEADIDKLNQEFNSYMTEKITITNKSVIINESSDFKTDYFTLNNIKKQISNLHPYYYINLDELIIKLVSNYLADSIVYCIHQHKFILGELPDYLQPEVYYSTMHKILPSFAAELPSHLIQFIEEFLCDNNMDSKYNQIFYPPYESRLYHPLIKKEFEIFYEKLTGIKYIEIEQTTLSTMDSLNIIKIQNNPTIQIKMEKPNILEDLIAIKEATATAVNFIFDRNITDAENLTQGQRYWLLKKIFYPHEKYIPALNFTKQRIEEGNETINSFSQINPANNNSIRSITYSKQRVLPDIEIPSFLENILSDEGIYNKEKIKYLSKTTEYQIYSFKDFIFLILLDFIDSKKFVIRCHCCTKYFIPNKRKGNYCTRTTCQNISKNNFSYSQRIKNEGPDKMYHLAYYSTYGRLKTSISNSFPSELVYNAENLDEKKIYKPLYDQFEAWSTEAKNRRNHALRNPNTIPKYEKWLKDNYLRFKPITDWSHLSKDSSKKE